MDLREKARRCVVPCDHPEGGPNRKQEPCYLRHDKKANTRKAYRELALAQSGGRCQLRITPGCTKTNPARLALGNYSMQVDHWYPFSQGGYDGPPNLVAACPNCNREKHDRDPDSACTVDGSYQCVRKDPTIKVPSDLLLPSFRHIKAMILDEMTCALFVFSKTCPPCHTAAPNFMDAVGDIGAEYDYVFMYEAGSPRAFVDLESALGIRIRGTPAFISIDGGRPRRKALDFYLPQRKLEDPDAIADEFLDRLG